MKKLLLLLLTLLTSVSSMWATDVTIIKSTEAPTTYGLLSGTTFTTNATSEMAGVTIEGIKGTTATNFAYGACLALTSTASGTITMTAPDGYIITGYTLTARSNTYSVPYTLTPSAGGSAVTTSTGGVTLTASGLGEQSASFTYSASSANSFYIPSMTITILAADASIVDVTYELYESDGTTKVSSVTKEQEENSAIQVPSSLTAPTYYDYNIEGSIGTEDCTIKVTRTLKTGYVISLDGLSNSKCYNIRNNRGTWAVGKDANVVNSTVELGLAFMASDVKQQFAFIYYDESDDDTDNGKYYLYSVGESKFAYVDGTKLSLTSNFTAEVAESPVTFQNSTNDPYKYSEPIIVTVGGNHFGVSTTYSPDIYKYNDQADGGNCAKVLEAGDFNASAAILEIKKYYYIKTYLKTAPYLIEDSNYDKPGFPTTAGKNAFIAAINAITTSDDFDTSAATAFATYKGTVKYPEVGKVYKLKEHAGTVLYAYSKKNDTTKPTMANGGTNTNNSFFRVTAIGTPSNNTATITIVDLYGNPLRYSTAVSTTSYADATAETTTTVTSIKTDLFSSTYGTSGHFYLGGAAWTTSSNKVDGGSAYNTLTNPYFLGTWTTQTYGGCQWTFEEVDVSSMTSYTITLSGAPNEITLADNTILNNGTATVYLSSAPTFPDIDHYWKSVSNDGNAYTVTYSDNYISFVIDNIAPYIQNLNYGEGYFRLTESEATALSNMFASYNNDSKISDEEYDDMFSYLSEHIDYPNSGYYTIKSKLTSKYLSSNGVNNDPLISVDLEPNCIAHLTETGSNTYTIAFLGTSYAYSKGAGQYWVTWSPGTEFSGKLYNGAASLYSNNAYMYSYNNGSISGFPALYSNNSTWYVEDATTIDISLQTVGTKSYATAYLPFPVLEVSGAKAYTLTVSESTATAHEISEFPAGTGVLLISDDNNDKATLTIGGSPVAPEGNVLSGHYLAGDIPEKSFIFANGTSGIGFYKINPSNLNVGANKAYIPADVVSNVKAILFNIDDEDGIIEIEKEETGDGNSSVYNLAGQRVVKAQKGIHIAKGKKIIIK